VSKKYTRKEEKSHILRQGGMHM